MSDIATLEKRIDLAFPGREKHIDEEDCGELRHAISRLDDASVKKILPALLVDILTVSQSGGSRDDDFVIYFLDGLKLDEANPEERRFRQKLADRTFQSFTKEQRSVISEWLSAVADYEFIKMCEEDYRSAVLYWERARSEIRQ
ncbi:hypothetical protein TSACC_2827 [Terrimicrobium sacchariphilum]|uniref:Uncharacterized protein n=1 Tax=Terrimicrobium sacchariphilum TaxID=690879 RepID=A0A146G3M6_TERSA|nr:DUF6714 family protein [Terrimicrobium sacchariphilum]GAT32429.1 hypothetical protein TSACC_2827 [Terrimicrobium sacchariphilum]